MEESETLKLARATAEQTADRLGELVNEKLTALEERIEHKLACLRDDLTVKGLVDAQRRPVTSTRSLGAHVLVVEDYKELLRSSVRTLEQAGFKVSSACTGEAAVAVLQNSLDIVVIVSDLSMPKNGRMLVDYVREKYPTVEVVIMSGYEQQVERMRELGVFTFLSKPFRSEHLLFAVESAIAIGELRKAAAAAKEAGP